MSQPKAEKLVSRVITYVNEGGVWHIPKFVYDNALLTSDKLIANPNSYRKAEGYLLRSITYFASGEHIDAIDNFEKLFQFELNPEIMSLYMSTLISQGKVEDAESFYKMYKDSIDETAFFLEIILLNRVALDLTKSNGYIQEYIDKDVPRRYIEMLQSNHKLVEEDLTNIEGANLDTALVQEVLAIATKVMTATGNFNATFRSYIDKPNDNLYINIYISNIDFEVMDGLNESWLEAMVDHDSSYDFSKLSRVVVNFRPETEGLIDHV